MLWHLSLPQPLYWHLIVQHRCDGHRTDTEASAGWYYMKSLFLHGRISSVWISFTTSAECMPAGSRQGALQGIHVNVACVRADQLLLLPARCDSEAASVPTAAWPKGVPQQLAHRMTYLHHSHTGKCVSMKLTWTRSKNIMTVKNWGWS